MLAPVVLFLAVTWLLSAALASQQVPFSVGNASELLSDDFSAWVEALLKKVDSPGVSIAVVWKDERRESGWIVETKGYGIRDRDGRKVDAESLFSIGSNSKLFAAISAGVLMKNESLSRRFDWNTKAVDVIPGWGLMDQVASRLVSLKDMLSHRTGLPRHDAIASLNLPLADTIAKMRYLRPSAELQETA